MPQRFSARGRGSEHWGGMGNEFAGWSKGDFVLWREAQNGVDSRSGILQTPKELVESPFPLRNQTWKETFCSWTRKPNSYPLSLGPEN
jgi:hypothetical protein